ncbi:hypothetical protein C8R44DRAFT_764735 [Mycena epipterygia]|nr:hypothetical protein C8R44DRAFT_764735 [Mycena epipterygia]
MVFLRPFTFCVLSVLNIAIKAAPLGLPDIHGRAARLGQYPRQSEISSLVSNITGQSVSDDAGLAQTLGSLFGGSSNSTSTLDPPSATISDPSSQITGNASIPSPTLPGDTPSSATADSSPSTGNAAIPSPIIPGSAPIVSQYTSTATSAGSEAGDAYSIISKLMGSIPTSLPSLTVASEPSIGTPPSDGFDGPGDGSNDENTPSTYPQQGGQYGQGGMSQNNDCAETYTVVSGDTCAAISSVFELSAADFVRMNPTVGAACMNLQVGQEYCVKRSSQDEDDEDEYEYGEGEDDEDGEGEDEGDDEGGVVIVNVHDHSDNPSWWSKFGQPIPTGGAPPSNIPVPPASPSAPISPVPSGLPTSDNPPGLNSTASPTSDPGSDSPGLNSTTPTSELPLPTSGPGSNSTGFNSTTQMPGSNSTSFNSTGFSDPDSSGSDSDSPTSPLTGNTPPGNGTGDPLTSQPATPSSTNTTSGPDDDPLSSSTSANSSDSSGSAAMGSRSAPLASPSPKAVKITWEEDF